ncbi:MAG: hypothetical protein M0D55_14345 [Elusimicrobiota bacterium]|nr:MAG: hypothetical protein M0D55_14345 [Elusimicrobiota bacterium]
MPVGRGTPLTVTALVRGGPTLQRRSPSASNSMWGSLEMSPSRGPKGGPAVCIGQTNWNGGAIVMPQPAPGEPEETYAVLMKTWTDCARATRAGRREPKAARTSAAERVNP